MSTNDEMKYALQLCITELLHDGVPTDPAHPRRVALDLAEKARASNTATVEQAEDVVDLIRKGFITSQSCGPDKHYQLVVKFQSLADLQAAHNAVVLYPESAQPRPASVREGWKLVPIEPDDVMVADGCSMHVCEQGDSYYRDEDLTEVDCIAIYKAVGITIKGRIRTFGPHLVMCDSLGRVYVRPADEKRASLMASRYPHMVVGVFNEAATSADIVEAATFVYDELAGVVA